jgi:hypothetical protein
MRRANMMVDVDALEVAEAAEFLDGSVARR